MGSNMSCPKVIPLSRIHCINLILFWKIVLCNIEKNHFSNKKNLDTKNSTCFFNSLPFRTKRKDLNLILKLTLKKCFLNKIFQFGQKKFDLILQIPICFSLGAGVALFDFGSIRVGDCSPANSPKNVFE